MRPTDRGRGLTVPACSTYKSDMLGLSVSKLILTALAIAAVFYGFRWLGRIQQRGGQRVRRRGTGSDPAGAGPSGRDRTQDGDVETMAECSVCGAYVSAARARSCGRDDCPYPG